MFWKLFILEVKKIFLAMVVFVCFGSYILKSNLISRQK